MFANIKLILRTLISKNLLYRIYKFYLLPKLEIIPKLQKQLVISAVDKIDVSAKKKVFIPLIETSHQISLLILIIAKILSIRGAEVLVLRCGSFLPACEIKSIRHPKLDPCMSCRAKASNFLPLFNLEILSINDFIDSKEFKELENIAKTLILDFHKNIKYKNVPLFNMVNDSLIRYFYGKIPNNSQEKIYKIKLKFIKTALISINISEKVHRDMKPDIIFGAMNVYADYAGYYDYFSSQNVDTATLSISAFDYSKVVLNSSSFYTSNDRYLNWLNTRENCLLQEDEEKELEGFLNPRFYGTASIFKEFNYFDDSKNIAEHLNLKNSLDNNKNVILLPNIFWDVGLQDCHTIFNSVVDWVVETAKLFANSNNINLFIKPHPGETLDSSSSLKGIKDFVIEAFPELPRNIKFIDPEMRLNTYDLIECMDYVITYNGTIGLEAMLKGIPVITAAKAPYSGLGLSNDPASQADYEDLVLTKKSLALPALSKVRLFAYFYFIKGLIPLNLQEKYYGSQFEGFSFKNLDDLRAGKNPNLDLIINYILDKDSVIPENWQD